jgi:hypothetical protein
MPSSRVPARGSLASGVCDTDVVLMIFDNVKERKR